MRLVVSKYFQEKWSAEDQYLAFDKFIETELIKSGVEKKNITTLPYLRTMDGDLIKNSSYVYNKSDIYVRILSEKLNETHKKKYSVLFWKTTMSLHLARYITFLHDFYFTINKIDLCDYDFNQISYNEISTPVNFEEQRELLQSSDIANEILLKTYIDYNQGASFLMKNNVNFKQNEVKKQSLKTKIKSTIKSLIYSLLPKKGSAHLGLINMEKYYTQDLKDVGCEKIKLKLDLHDAYKNDLVSRSSLFKGIEELDDFDNYFLYVSYYLFPQHLIETFNQLVFVLENKIKKYYRKEFVLSETWIFSSVVSIAIALLRDKSVKLVLVEHNAISHVYEGRYTDYLTSISDVYLTLGWKKSNDNKFVPGKFYFKQLQTEPDKKKGILYISGAPQVKMAIHSTFYSLCAEYVQIHFNYVEEFFRLGKGLSFMSELNYRGYPKKKNVYTYDKEYILGEYLQEIKGIADLEESCLSQIMKSELVIVDYLSTAHLEALIMNHPVIILSSNDSYILKDEHKNFYNVLIEANIVMLNMRDAVSFLNENQGHYLEWWQSEKIQNARIEFLEKNLGYGVDFKSLIMSIKNEQK